MRKQIAAANWKMNMTFQQGEKLLDEILGAEIAMGAQQQTIFAVPYPYLLMTRSEVEEEFNYEVAAQNCHHLKSGAYTGEVSVEMLHSINIKYCITGHSERREYNGETNAMLAEKVNLCLEHYITPIFCCGEPLGIREAGTQNEFVALQLKESLFHLPAEKVRTLIIAYEPIWAIGTGKVATVEQAEEVHLDLRKLLETRYNAATAGSVRILYGGSVNAGNASQLLAAANIDGALVGGASLKPEDFLSIIAAA